METYGKALVKNILRGMLPYPDPVRRRRIRSAARSLVDCEPWPDDDATTGPDVAKLALMRVLWLQRESRRAARYRHTEAAVLLARSSVEACLLGVYCLHEPDAVRCLRAANIKAMSDMLRYLVEDGILTKGVVDQSLAALGSSGYPPKVFAMAEHVDKALPGSGAVSLYRRFYAPTSNFFVHASPASLLRHVRTDDKISNRPDVPWTRRSAVRISDACVGILAGSIASAATEPDAVFEEYANAHLVRALTPVAVAAGRGLRHSVKLSGVPAMIRAIRDLEQYAASEQAMVDTPDVREAHVRSGVEQCLRAVMDPGLPEEVVQPLLDHFVGQIVASIAAPATGAGSSPGTGPNCQ